MEFRLIPPSIILSKLNIASLDDLGKTSETFRDERTLSPSEKSGLRGKTAYEMAQNMKMFYYRTRVRSEDIHHIINDILKNSIEYNPKENSVFIGAYGTLDLKLIACNDGGEYFRKDSTKSMWENREFEKEHHHWGVGQDFIYGHGKDSHEIIVDIQQGTLYVLKPVTPFTLKEIII